MSAIVSFFRKRLVVDGQSVLEGVAHIGFGKRESVVTCGERGGCHAKMGRIGIVVCTVALVNNRPGFFFQMPIDLRIRGDGDATQQEEDDDDFFHGRKI